MDKNVIFDYNQEDHVASCCIGYKKMWFSGVAHCHPDDIDFASERTGCYIAECRAVIQVLCYQRDHELKPMLKLLNHLYSNMKTSKHFNPISYEAKMIRSQIRSLEKELTAINNDLVAERKSLSEYLKGKEKLYEKLRDKNQ